MYVPSTEELAAIAAAYLVVTGRAEPAQQPERSRWALAGRLGLDDAAEPRFIARTASRWNIAARLDG